VHKDARQHRVTHAHSHQNRVDSCRDVKRIDNSECSMSFRYVVCAAPCELPMHAVHASSMTCIPPTIHTRREVRVQRAREVYGARRCIELDPSLLRQAHSRGRMTHRAMRSAARRRCAPTQRRRGQATAHERQRAGDGAQATVRRRCCQAMVRRRYCAGDGRCTGDGARAAGGLREEATVQGKRRYGARAGRGGLRRGGCAARLVARCACCKCTAIVTADCKRSKQMYSNVCSYTHATGSSGGTRAGRHRSLRLPRLTQVRV